MEHESLETLFEMIIAVGFSKKITAIPHKGKVEAITFWENTFDLNAWKPCRVELVREVIKDELLEQGSLQEVSVRGLFIQSNDFGYDTCAGLKFVFNRKMPVRMDTIHLSPFHQILGCPWHPTEIYYYKSPLTKDKVIALDPVKKEVPVMHTGKLVY